MPPIKTIRDLAFVCARVFLVLGALFYFFGFVWFASVQATNVNVLSWVLISSALAAAVLSTRSVTTFKKALVWISCIVGVFSQVLLVLTQSPHLSLSLTTFGFWEVSVILSFSLIALEVARGKTAVSGTGAERD